jgi:hypothetical protein
VQRIEFDRRCACWFVHTAPTDGQLFAFLSDTPHMGYMRMSMSMRVAHAPELYSFRKVVHSSYSTVHVHESASWCTRRVPQIPGRRFSSIHTHAKYGMCPNCELTKYGDQENVVHASYTKGWFGVRVPYCTSRVPAVYAFRYLPKSTHFDGLSFPFTDETSPPAACTR